ncbi:unnamed protein product [Cylicocyclus nassatus]|uniref:Uncharacterized protein n=1 Tax=Cylicocyclus nassatus TaxID=53992 RepID=A0AA36HH54_CYLNA|nr:unnamed protein product [Cylicocyclus nassatus]
MYIGVGEVNAEVKNVFTGIINLNYANLKINNELVWQGMDDVGLATRLAVDMSNIDPAEKNVEIGTLKAQIESLKEEYDPELDDYTHIFFAPQSRTTVYSFQINPTGETTIDWGDGTTPDTLTTTGIQFVSHTYDSLTSASASNNGVGSVMYTQVEIKIHSDSSYSIEVNGQTGIVTLDIPSLDGYATEKYVEDNYVKKGEVPPAPTDYVKIADYNKFVQD